MYALNYLSLQMFHIFSDSQDQASVSQYSLIKCTLSQYFITLSIFLTYYLIFNFVHYNFHFHSSTESKDQFTGGQKTTFDRSHLKLWRSSCGRADTIMDLHTTGLEFKTLWVQYTFYRASD